MTHALPGPVSGSKLTDDYLRTVGRMAYLWGWPLVNMHNRLSIMAQLPSPGLIGGIIPGAPPGQLGMLNDYIRPEQRLVACPNQDVVYGFGIIDANGGPSIIQVPDFGDRFWVYQVVDQRTDSFVKLGKMYGTRPGAYLLAPTGWDGKVPDEIVDIFRFDTRIAVTAPRVFMDDTDEDRVAIQPIVNQIGMYPMHEYTGRPRSFDWANVPSFNTGTGTSGERETQWVDPNQFFPTLPPVLSEVPARPGEEALYAWIGSLLDAAAADPGVAELLRQTAVDADQALVQELFEFRNIGVPVARNWTTQRNGAAFGTDYLSRTAMGKANIFVNTPTETAYFYQDLDSGGNRLNGANTYAVTFDPGELPPVGGFWSLTLYNAHHFFHPNELNRYSLGTKNKHLQFGDDGSLTLTVVAAAPNDGQLANWIPAPDGEFSLYLRAYWPDDAVLTGEWTPPPVRLVS
jgi:hypothetical protein